MLGIASKAIAMLFYVVCAMVQTKEASAQPQGLSMGRILGVLGAVFHGASLLYVAVSPEAGPGFAESLSAASFGIMVSYLLVQGQMKSFGVYLVPIAALLLGASLLVPSPQVAALKTIENSVWLPIHLGFLFAGFAAFFLEFFVGIIQMAVRSRLKRKQFAGLDRFPSLDVLDRVQLRSLGFGLLCLTFGVVAGGAFAADGGLPHQEWVSDPKVVLSLTIWVWYFISFTTRIALGWHGRWSMTFSALGFSGLLFSLGPLNFVMEGFHAYGS